MDKAIEILNLIESKGFKAYIVGGAVRDYVLNKPNTIYDYDLCSNISHEAIYELFEVKSNLYNSYKITYKDLDFELTIFRSETESNNHRHPEKIYIVQNYQEDSLRRDFTMNSLYMDKNKTIYDPQNGIEDIKQGIIRLIGNKTVRFQEDALRMLRAIYFKNKLNFIIEDNTYRQIILCNSYIKDLSKQKILEMLVKMIQLNKFKSVITDLFETGIYKYIQCFKSSIEFAYKKKIEEINLLEFFCLTQRLDDKFLTTYELTKIQKDFIKDVDILSIVLEDDDLNSLLLFTYKLEKCLCATKINNLLYDKHISIEKVKKSYNELPIKNVCDLKFKGYDLISKYKLKSVTNIALMVDDIKYQVIMKNIANDYDKIRIYVENKYKGVFINE